MCGIAGIAALGAGSSPTRGELAAMIGRLRHRGPDDDGIFLDRGVGLAHARLAIIDLAGGKQPMASPDGDLWVAFNGEVFNFVELRAALEREGRVFRTSSDTEVLLHLYRRDGLDFVHSLGGQFAVALWDRSRRRLVLARDRVGIRPLYYTRVADRLCFASEIKALLAARGVSARLSLRGLAEVFTFWAVQPPATAFEGISSLPPGHLLAIDVDSGAISQRRYWDWDFAPPADPGRATASYAEELAALLEDAVRIQLRSDVPVGAYLSGGLDSAGVAAMVRFRSDTPLRTFSIAFEDAEFDESTQQAEMVRHLGSRHTRIDCRKADIGAAFPRAVWHAETPLVRTACVPLMLLAGHVREAGYKVVLTGEGADEVFGGYDLFKEARIRRFWARRPESALRPALLDRLYPYLAHSPTAARAFAMQFFRLGFEDPRQPGFGHLPRWTTTRRLWRFFSREAQAELAGWDPVESLIARLPAAFATWEPLCQDQYLEAHTLLSSYLLAAQGDRPAMAHSVEARHPYLDHRVIAFAAALPPRLKLSGLGEKFLLRRALAPLLPRQIAARPKQPYRAPDSLSFFAGSEPTALVREFMSPAHLAAGGLFDPEPTLRLLEKCRRGEAIGFADNMAFTGILSTLLLAESFCRSTPGAVTAA
ncbi:MAG: asparagine synthase (glutamine-hydrolyzing) [Candidatus Sericytochromatia bacterium]|nr:asparagine synthase (glutamine-hydrolyzing) [Candidatus Tanganyikabacteria bacterium]